MALCCSARAAPPRAWRLSAVVTCSAAHVEPQRGHVAIVGGGIAGVSAALALRRRGYDAVVYEARRGADCAHAGITLSGASLAALRRIDATVADAVIAAGDVINTVVLRDPRGQLLAETHTGRALGSGDEEPTLCVRWDELWRIIAQALPAEALRFGHALEDFTDASTASQPTHSSRTASSAAMPALPVLAVFSHRDTFGQVAAPAVALIGADGVRSRVRQIWCPSLWLRLQVLTVLLTRSQVRRLLYGNEPAPCDASATVWRGVVDSRAVPAGLCPQGAVVHAHAADGRTLSLMSLGTGGSSLHDGALYWVASLPSEIPLGEAAPGNLAAACVDLKQHASAEARTLSYLVQSPGGSMPLAVAASAPLVADRVSAAFADFCDFQHVLRATPVGEIVERRLFYRASSDAADDEDDAALHRGVVTLVGDAATMRLPSLGLGACLSIESAAALGDVFGAVPASAGPEGIAAALRSFEEGQSQRARQAARAALDEARRVAAAPSASMPAPGPAFAGWLLGNARRGQAEPTLSE